MSKGCNSCSTSCDMHGGSRSVITPAGGAQGVAWGEPNNLPGSDGRDVSKVGNHFSLNNDAGAMPDPQSGGGCGCEKVPIGGKRRRRHSPKKKGKKRRTRRRTKGRKGKKSRRRTKGRKGKKSRRRTKGRKSRGRRGKNRRTKRRMMRGGGLFDDRNRIFQPATNLARNTLFGAGEMVNQWKGKPAPLNPAPTVQDRLTPMDNVVLPNIPDVPGIHQAAGQAVANI